VGGVHVFERERNAMQGSPIITLPERGVGFTSTATRTFGIEADDGVDEGVYRFDAGEMRIDHLLDRCPSQANQECDIGGRRRGQIHDAIVAAQLGAVNERRIFDVGSSAGPVYTSAA